MKKSILLWAALVVIQLHTTAQTRISAGAGYYGENVTNQGIVLEFEIEKFHTGSFSLPLRTDLGFHSNPDYQAITLDIHKGFRKYFDSGLFLEQSLGAGVITKSYKGNYWYIDKYLRPIPHGNKAVLGFMPSATAGAGYNFSKNDEGSDLIWVRPKIYWDLGFRGLNLPYWALQIGFTHTFKTK
jgi:hypothetical protein